MSILSRGESLSEHINEYIDLQKEKFLLNAAHKSSRVFAELLVKAVYVLCIFIAILMLSFGIAFALNTYFLNWYVGFLILSVFYAILAFFLYKRGKSMLGNFLTYELLNIFYEDENENGKYEYQK